MITAQSRWPLWHMCMLCSNKGCRLVSRPISHIDLCTCAPCACCFLGHSQRWNGTMQIHMPCMPLPLTLIKTANAPSGSIQPCGGPLAPLRVQRSLESIYMYIYIYTKAPSPHYSPNSLESSVSGYRERIIGPLRLNSRLAVYWPGARAHYTILSPLNHSVRSMCH